MSLRVCSSCVINSWFTWVEYLDRFSSDLFWWTGGLKRSKLFRRVVYIFTTSSIRQLFSWLDPLRVYPHPTMPIAKYLASLLNMTALQSGEKCPPLSNSYCCPSITAHSINNNSLFLSHLANSTVITYNNGGLCRS